MNTSNNFKAVASTLMRENLETVLMLDVVMRSCAESDKDVYSKVEVLEIIKNIQDMIKCDLNIAKAEALSNGTFHEIAEILEENFKEIIKE